MYIEIIGLLSTLLILIASGYIAIFQKIPLFVWIFWIIGSILSLWRAIVLPDTWYILIFLSFIFVDVLGIYRWFRNQEVINRKK